MDTKNIHLLCIICIENGQDSEKAWKWPKLLLSELCLDFFFFFLILKGSERECKAQQSQGNSQWWSEGGETYGGVKDEGMEEWGVED